MFALQQGNLNNFAAHYMHTKIPFGGLFANYMVNSNSFGVPGVLMGGNLNGLSSASLNTQPLSRISLDTESLDLRRSSIDKLRLKAKEHSVVIDTSPKSSPVDPQLSKA